MNFFVFVSEQWLLVSLLTVLIYLYFWTERRKSGPTLSIHSATRLVNSGEAVVIDVREAKEFKEGHIVDAINIPFNKINDSLTELEKHQQKTLLLVDKMSTHTGNVGRILGKAGFTVARLEGGMTEWNNQSLPVVK